MPIPCSNVRIWLPQTLAGNGQNLITTVFPAAYIVDLMSTCATFLVHRLIISFPPSYPSPKSDPSLQLYHSHLPATLIPLLSPPLIPPITAPTPYSLPLPLLTHASSCIASMDSSPSSPSSLSSLSAALTHASKPRPYLEPCSLPRPPRQLFRPCGLPLPHRAPIPPAWRWATHQHSQLLSKRFQGWCGRRGLHAQRPGFSKV